MEPFFLLRRRPFRQVVVLLRRPIRRRPPQHPTPLREVNQRYYEGATYDHHPHQSYPGLRGVPGSSKKDHLCENRTDIAAAARHPGYDAERPLDNKRVFLVIFAHIKVKYSYK